MNKTLLDYSQERIHQHVSQIYRSQREQGIAQSVQEIMNKLPKTRIQKAKYSFAFDSTKQSVEDEMEASKAILEIQKREKQIIDAISIANVSVNGEAPVPDSLYSEKLSSGLPIFKSIIYMRYQDHSKYNEIFGEDRPFAPDRSYIDFAKIANKVKNLKLFIEDEGPIKSILVSFSNQNTLNLVNMFPDYSEIQMRAQAMAKMYLLRIFTDEQRKIKQAFKNDQNFVQLQKQVKKVKDEEQSEKQKDTEISEAQMLGQVNKVMQILETRANVQAYNEFRNNEGKSAANTKKGIEMLQSLLANQPLTKNKLKILMLYLQKKNW